MCVTLLVCMCVCVQIQEMEAVVRQSQTYAQTLQNYNTSLQTDVQVSEGGWTRLVLASLHHQGPQPGMLFIARM